MTLPAGRPPRILVTRLRYLGDVLLSTPLVAALRRAHPDARLEYLVEEAFAPVLDGNPHLDRVHAYPAGASLADLGRQVRELRRARFDAVIDLFGNPRSALLSRLSGAPLRVGPARGARSRLFTHRRGRPGGDRSAIRHHLDKAIPLLGRRPEAERPRLWVREEECRRADENVGAVPTSKTVVLHPGSKWADKAWPHERWPVLMNQLDGAGVDPLRVVDPPAEEGLAARLCGEAGVGEPLPRLGLRELFAWMSRAGLYVGNDGGILHAAVALGCPTLGLFGPTEPDIWFPYSRWGPYRVLHRDPPTSLGGIQVAEVREAALTLLDEAGESTAHA